MDNTFFIHVHNREYSDYEFFMYTENGESEKITLEIDPIGSALFHGDEFTIDSENHVHIQKSPTREAKHIPGVLILQNNKTYGRTANKKRLLYKCIPYNTKLPAFLVPSDVTLEFSKFVLNKYVLFTFHNWDSRHPQGVLSESLGNVDDLTALSEYELHGSNLYYSMKDMNKYVKKTLKCHNDMVDEICHSKQFTLQYKTDQYIFSIDPHGSADYDDAFAIEDIDGQTVVTVHIANVAIWLEYLKMWNLLTDRISTIYLPECKKTMLPLLLSDQVCSLQQKQKNVTMFVRFPLLEDGKIDFDHITFGNAVVKIRKNYVYEEERLLSNEQYKHLYQTTHKLDSHVSDSHDVVSFWMVQVNTYLAKVLYKHDIGIFRNSTLKYNERMNFDFDKQTCDTLFHYKNASANYVNSKEDDLKHDVMNKDLYTHITSPIRRNVDLMNQLILLYRCHCINGLSSSAQKYLISWMENLDKLNTYAKNTRQLQNRIQLIYSCRQYTRLSDEIMNGIVIEAKKSDTVTNYTIFIKELQVFLPAVSDKELSEYQTCSVKVFLFEDENSVRNKIKIQIL